jgi:ATP-dependent Clp protease adaptor protein ClpS
VWAAPYRQSVTCDDEAMTSTTTERVSETEDLTASDRVWVTLVWNDPVNLMSYVAYVFQKLFGYSHDKATQLMLQVHQEGRAVVSAGTREEMERDVARLHAAGLWATLQRD